MLSIFQRYARFSLVLFLFTGAGIFHRSTQTVSGQGAFDVRAYGAKGVPAYGFFIRHAKGIEMNNVEVSYMKEDLRPAFALDDVKGATFQNAKAQRAADAPIFALKNVEDFSVRQSNGVPDTRLGRVAEKKL